MATRLGTLLWWTVLALATAATAGQQTRQGYFGALFAHGSPSTGGAHSTPTDHSRSSTYNKPPSGQLVPVSTKIASVPVTTLTVDERGSPPARSPRPAAKKASSVGLGTDPSSTFLAASEVPLPAAAPALGPAPGPGAIPDLDLDFPERTCVFVCLIDVACSRNTAKCDTQVFLAGSYWCRFFSECPAFDPIFTVFYIPYKPPDAPPTSGAEDVTVPPPGPARAFPGDAPPAPGPPAAATAVSISSPGGPTNDTGDGPPPAPGTIARLTTPPDVPPPGDDEDDKDDEGEPPASMRAAAPAKDATAIPPRTTPPTAAFVPSPDDTADVKTALVPPSPSVGPPSAGTAAQAPSAATVARPGPVPVPPSSPRPRPAPRPVPRPAPRPVPRPVPIPTPRPPPPVPLCTYVCEDEICNSDVCIPVQGTSVCTFVAMCPPDAPEPRTIHLPLEAETDPPERGLVAPAPAPGPSEGIVPAPGPGVWIQFSIGG
eukprot:evm.model.scf_1980EXC.2 EVM.evm.TU.scf_1980EXC.2   scf_1980EXC:4263-7791(+)